MRNNSEILRDEEIIQAVAIEAEMECRLAGLPLPDRKAVADIFSARKSEYNLVDPYRIKASIAAMASEVFQAVARITLHNIQSHEVPEPLLAMIAREETFGRCDIYRGLRLLLDELASNQERKEDVIGYLEALRDALRAKPPLARRRKGEKPIGTSRPLREKISTSTKKLQHSIKLARLHPNHFQELQRFYLAIDSESMDVWLQGESGQNPLDSLDVDTLNRSLEYLQNERPMSRAIVYEKP